MATNSEIASGSHPSAASAAGGNRVVISGLTRSFGETRALVDATLTLAAGEIHALVGENGSGKSTMIKILSGVLPPDSGELLLDGRGVSFNSPRAAQAAGIATVFQEMLVAQEMTVRDNIFFGTDKVFRHGRDRKREIADASRALGQIGLPGFNLDRPMWTLSLAERQLVTIARAIVRPWQTLILDEASSALDANQRDRLFAYVRAAKAEGKSILFTSHRMDEVFELADTITVLRTGSSVMSSRAGDTSHQELLAHMSGEERAAAGQRVIRQESERPAAAAAGKVVLRVEDFVLRRSSQPLALELRRGEILGIAGLEGQGQVEFVECVCGLRKAHAGRVVVVDADAQEHAIRSYREANRRGVRYVPRDRRYEGLFATLSVFDNFAISSWKYLNYVGWLRRQEARRRFREYSASSRLVAGSPDQPIGTLSGGNQQKILLGRWIAMAPDVLVLNDPLRGVDANTKEELYEYFRRLADEGLAIVFLSTEILELLRLADDIAVFHEGNLQATLTAKDSEDTDIIAAMFGKTSGAA